MNYPIWQSLTDYVLDNADLGSNISIFTGPLFRADDTMYSGILQIPSEIWKIIVLKREIIDFMRLVSY